MSMLLTIGPDIQSVRAQAKEIAAQVLRPRAQKIDAEANWPREGMTAIAEAGLLGLHMPRRLGGLEQGLVALAVVTEELGHGCSSTAMCFGMHIGASMGSATNASDGQA